VNIFKVLASSKDGFKEVQASIMIAWLLNPYMEHGLGFTFLNKFLQKIDKNNNSFNKLNNILQPILRSKKSDENLKFSSDIEFNVGKSFIDIILFINDFIISIENKIHNESAGNQEQLSLQYTGLKNKYGKDYKKIFMVFLVPDEENSKVKSEFDNLTTNGSDEKIIIEWNVVRDIIQEIIDEDQKCIISPINEYLRHTLKAFASFIDDDFNGYYFETTRNYGAANPLAEGRKSLEQIKEDDSITFVGVRYGIIGLLLFDKEEITSKTFQYTTTESMNSYCWISREVFIKICKYIVNNEFETLDWIDDIGKVPAESIYRIAKNTSEEFYVRIKGGEESLKAMDRETIAEKLWSISITQNTKQWIAKEKYLEILDNKNFFG
jgi:hypothetical protein